MDLLNKVEDLHNKASDTRFVWFPFTWLKPKPSEPLRFGKLILMSFFFGFYYGIFFALRNAWLSDTDLLSLLPKNIAIATAAFFVWFNLVTATFWNRRARRLLGK